MAAIDWSVLSGPRVSRRTMMKLAAATGAVGFANRLSGLDAAGAPRFTGASATALRQEAKPGGTLRLGFGLAQIPTLDPAQINVGIVAGEIIPNLFSGLVQFDEELTLLPDLAETWEVSEDGLQYTFKLRQGLTFHNGDPLMAADVIYTYERTTNPDFASPHANKLANVTEITAPDELTVHLTLSAPFAPFLATACSRGPGRALAPVPRRAVEELGDEQFGITPVGSGPFKIVPETADLNSRFDMVAFEGWYGGRPLLDKIEVRIIPEQSSMVSALEAGDVDMLDIAPAIGVEQLRQNDEIVLVEVPGTNWVGLTMNQKRPPWDKVEARMAVSKAIDREDLIAKAFFGLAVPSVGAIAPAFAWAYQPPEEVENPQAFNKEEAKTLAEQAGLTGLRPTIMTTVVNPRPSEVIRNQLRDIGLDVQIEQLQTAAWNDRWLASDYDWLVNGSVVDADPDDGHWNFFRSDGPWNTFGYVSARADELLEATRQTADQEERARLYQELQILLETEVAYAFLYHTPDKVAFHDYVKGYVPIPEMRYLEHVWLDQ